MMKLILGIAVMLPLCLWSCRTKPASQQAISGTPMGAERILADAFAGHGGKQYEDAHYEFMFRGNSYTFNNSQGNYEYTVRKKKDDEVTVDIVTNSTFTRMVNGVDVILSPKDQKKYSASLNSVIYFATLPHKLLDPAVNIKEQKSVSIKGQQYNVLEITFEEEGGGADHDDTYYYWINAETKLIDYLAYNFHVDKGGVRFRSAYNSRNVDGIVFQDYVNYKAPMGTDLADLPEWYEQGKLEKLSEIKTEDVRKMYRL